MKRFGIISIFLLLLTSCQEEMFPENKFEAGLPAALSLDLTVPTANDIAVTKAINDYESEIREFALILANGNSIQNIVDLTGNLQSKSTTTQGGRTYKLANPVTEGLKGAILSGTYTIYGIANWSSPFCNLTLEAIQNFKSVNDLKAALSTNPDLALTVSGSQLFPMSGVNESVNILPIEASAGNTETAPNGNSISISLKRIISHIEFVFKNDNNEESPKFVPTSYSIYNLPKGAKLISSEDNQVNTEYGHQENLEIPGSEIRFFMLENVKPAGSNTSYADRDKWTGPSGASPTEKQFTNAPEGSTFVVVKGEYSGKSYFGHVSYTIHLGNFSGKSTDKSPAGNNNFTINRNEYHKYTVTVKGVNNIAAEAEVETPNNGGDVPAAEGTLTEISNKLQFVLDAHYETVMLSFDLNGLCENPSMIINTPFTNGAEKYSFTDDISNADYKWIHFMAPTSASVLPKYDNTKTCTVDQLAAELKAAWNNGNKLTTAPSGSHYIISGGKVYTTAFIDEYYYEGKDWTTFVNTDNRILILNPDEEVSPDGNSVLYPDYIFSIAQRSIKTTYLLDPTVNAFGIETWDETGLLEFAAGGLTKYQKSDMGLTLDNSHGWANTRAYWLQESDVQGNNWTTGKWISTDSFGYLTTVSDNLKESHKYTGSGVSKLNTFNACLTRNRDEDGDGNIDEDEIKWYLPAIEQYTTLWLGDEYLKEDTRLFDATTQDYLDGQIHYFSSSTHTKRLYYPAEGAAYGKVEDATWAPSEQNVRCVRSLKDRTAIPTSITENDEGKRIIYVNGASELTLRRQYMKGEYKDQHVERDTDNKLPLAFQVGQVDLGENIPLDESIVLPETTTEWLIPGESVNVTYTRATTQSWFSKTTYYTFTIEFCFSGVDGATYTCNSSGATCTSDGNNNWTVKRTLSRSSNNSGNTSFNITATLNDESNIVSVNVAYSATNTSEDGNYSGSGTIVYTNDKTTTPETTISWISTGKGNNSRDLYTTSTLKSANDPCATGYHEEADGSDLGHWRVPNQREVMLMIQWNYFPAATHPDIDRDSGITRENATWYTSSTYYTGDNGNGNPFVYVKAGFTRGESTRLFIRCVRDADHISTNPDDGEDGDDEGGNTGTGGGSGSDLTR